MQKFVGFEAANSFVKSKSDTREEVYLNTRKVVPRFRESVFGQEGEAKKTYRVNWDANSYVVGDAEGISSSSRDHKRYGKESYRMESIIAISRHIQNDDAVKVVTGLPGDHYRIQECKDDVKKLEGEQIIYENEKAKVFHIEKVIPILQPLGSLFYLMLNTDGTYRGETGAKLAKGKKLIVDIGWGSSDLAVLDGFDLIHSEGLDHSMINAYEFIRDEIKEKDPVLKYNIFELEQAVRHNNGIFNKAGKSFDLKAWKEDAYASVARNIMDLVTNQFEPAQYDFVIFTGGGLIPLECHLARYINSDNVYPIKEKPQMANAIGYYIYSKFGN